MARVSTRRDNERAIKIALQDVITESMFRFEPEMTSRLPELRKIFLDSADLLVREVNETYDSIKAALIVLDRSIDSLELYKSPDIDKMKIEMKAKKKTVKTMLMNFLVARSVKHGEDFADIQKGFKHGQDEMVINDRLAALGENMQKTLEYLSLENMDVDDKLLTITKQLTLLRKKQ